MIRDPLFLAMLYHTLIHIPDGLAFRDTIGVQGNDVAESIGHSTRFCRITDSSRSISLAHRSKQKQCENKLGCEFFTLKLCLAMARMHCSDGLCLFLGGGHKVVRSAYMVYTIVKHLIRWIPTNPGSKCFPALRTPMLAEQKQEIASGQHSLRHHLKRAPRSCGGMQPRVSTARWWSRDFHEPFSNQAFSVLWRLHVLQLWRRHSEIWAETPIA